jgi:hypothetical protein
MKAKRLVFFAAVLVMAFMLVACEKVKIGDINADPGRFMGKEVGVVGTVTQSIGALGKGIYQVDDGSGRLWVLSMNHGVPAKGAKVGVKGHITQSITFLGINYATVLQENDRKRG